MKKFLLALLLLIIIGAGGYHYYTNYVDREPPNVWNIVPASAVMVYESPRVVQDWNEFSNSTLWQLLKGTSAFADVEQDLAMLDSLAGGDGRLDRLTTGKPFLISAHVTGKDKFGFLYLFHLDNLKEYGGLKDMMKPYMESDSYKKRERTYEGITIKEVVDPATGRTFTYFYEDRYFACSFTPFLVEDVIRTIKNEGQDNFQVRNPALRQLSGSDDDLGNLFVDLDALSPLFKTVAAPSTHSQLSILTGLGDGALLDIRTRDGYLLMDGFSVTESGRNAYLDLFQNQKAHEIGMSRFISDRTALLYHLGIDDAGTWRTNLKELYTKGRRKELKSNEVNEADVEQLMGYAGSEAALAVLESVDKDNPDRIAYLSARDMGGMYNALNNLAEKVHKSEDSLYAEPYGERTIRQLEVSGFPRLLLGDVFEGFDQCFYTTIDNYIVFGNHIQVLKNLLTDMETENTWGQSIRQTRFLEKSMREANLTVMVNTPRAWSLLQSRLRPEWVKTLNKDLNIWRLVDNMAVQFRHLDGKYYTTVLIDHRKDIPARERIARYELSQEATAGARLVTSPHVVRSHMTNGREVLVQDSSFALHLIGADGNLQWTDSLGMAMKTPAEAIDYFNNGRFQYFFATDSALHIIDRSGNRTGRYPVQMPESVQIAHASVVDYDRSKRYRFMIGAADGDIYLFDKEGNILEGWGPRETGNRLSQPPNHLRVRGKDVMYAIRQDGVVHIMNRRGENFPGFPLDLQGKIETPVFIEIGASVASTYMTAITREGARIRFNLKGEITKRSQLYKPSPATRFHLVPDATGRTFIIARQDGNRLSILDREGGMIFEKDYVTSPDLKVQYYYFGSGNELFAITDTEQEFTYLYDRQGNLINYQPLESSHMVSIMYHEAEQRYDVYATYEDTFRMYSFEAR
ncbi:hypothetical protein AB9P05_15640 [Roseivirga sp. BDSF3-8]|uniref:hypothetical protein n=1 Tax=Roseivirga sp. BDSF3-8 TaxID=3241598 RepID=UPI003531B11D